MMTNLDLEKLTDPIGYFAGLKDLIINSIDGIKKAC